ncbi:uncharacterized protein AB9W97_021332 isoform 4-T4 [Spinachia spinachia]
MNGSGSRIDCGSFFLFVGRSSHRAVFLSPVKSDESHPGTRVSSTPTNTGSPEHHRVQFGSRGAPRRNRTRDHSCSRLCGSQQAKMEACAIKPPAKKQPKPPKPPPKPTQTERNDPARRKKPTAPVPERPPDDELIQTQYRRRRAANDEANVMQTPVVPPRPGEKQSQSEVPRHEVDFKQSDRAARTGVFHQRQAEKTPSFTSYLSHNTDEKTVPTKPTPDIDLTSPDPSAQEVDSEKEQPAGQRKQEAKQDIGGLLAGMFRKTPKEKTSPAVTVSEAGAPEDAAESAVEEKGGFFSGILKKTVKATDETPGQDLLVVPGELSGSNDSLSDNGTKKEKGGIFSGMFKKKSAEASQTDKHEKEAGDSNETPSEDDSKQQKGGVFGGMFKKSPKLSDAARLGEGNLSASDDSLSEAGSAKEKGGAFSGLFKKSPSRSDSPPADEVSLTVHLVGRRWTNASDEDRPTNDEPSTENSSENKQEKGGGLFSGLLKKTPKSPEREAENSPASSAGEDAPAKEKNLFSNMFRKPQKPPEEPAADDEATPQEHLSGSCENLCDAGGPKEKKGGLAGFFKRSASIDDLFDEEKGGLFSGLIKKTPRASGDAADDRDDQKDPSASNDDLFENANAKEKSIFSGMFKKTPKPTEGTPADEESSDDKTLPGSRENLSEGHASKVKAGGFAGIFKKSPKPVHRSVASNDPLHDSKDLYASCDSLTEDIPSEMSTSNDNEATSAPKEKKVGFANKFRKTPKTQQPEAESAKEAAGGPRRRTTIRRKKRVVSFRIKKTPPKIPKLGQSSQGSETMPLIEEAFELQELNSAAPEGRVEHQPVEMAAYPTEGNPLESQQDIDDDLMDWWNTVKGWAEWNETSHFQEGDEETAMEQAADRVYMAARLFVRFFNRRGASLQHRILELLALADAADDFHKKTVKAAVGGGVASVAGSLATITGLILAPFTFGASIIVTAVGIGVATAGSITSATANITDAVHSNMDRKKLEKMIQGYQDEIKDIRECLDFVQAGMDTLQEWDFEKYSESAAKKALNHNLKHVMKEGGRAGKALMINTDKLISTVQVLGAAGGAAKAAQAISVTTGVMSALFLALDVFFLAKDSHELRKGAKTKFATKIRDVCKELQDGLLELNKVKTQLQKTMDGIEVEEYEEIKEVEEEVDDEDFESDPKKLAELEQELDLLEEKLDKKVDEGLKSKEMEKEMLMSQWGKGEPEEKKDKEEKVDAKNEGKTERKTPKNESQLKIPDEEKEQKNESIKAAKEEQRQKGKKDKDSENQVTAGRERQQSKRDLAKEDHSAHRKAGKQTGDSKREGRGGETPVEMGGESKRSPRGREEESEVKPEWRPGNKDAAADGWRRSSDTGRRPRTIPGSWTDAKGTGQERARKQSDRTWTSRGAEEEEEAGGEDHDMRAETETSRDERRGSRVERARRRFETPEEEKGKREEDGDARGSDRAMRRSGEGTRGSDRGTRGSGEGTRGSDRGTRGSGRRPRPTSKALLEDGLNI